MYKILLSLWLFYLKYLFYIYFVSFYLDMDGFLSQNEPTQDNKKGKNKAVKGTPNKRWLMQNSDYLLEILIDMIKSEQKPDKSFKKNPIPSGCFSCE